MAPGFVRLTLPFLHLCLVCVLPVQAHGGSNRRSSFLEKRCCEKADTLQNAQAAALKTVQSRTAEFFARLNKRFEGLQLGDFNAIGAYKAYREELFATLGADETTQFPVREKENSILVSIAAYRDNELHTTLQDLVGRAQNPKKVFVALVQQTCSGRSEPCMSGVLMGGQVKRHPPDEDTEKLFCSEEAFKDWCLTNMRVIKLEEADSLGPTVARFLASRLWMGETYFMQLDAHMRLAPRWDTLMIEQIKGAPSAKPILSTYPASGSSNTTEWVNFPGPRMCSSYFAKEEGDILRLLGSSTIEVQAAARPVPTPWIAAGYFMAPGQFLKDVPFDPLTPWVFMGEELALTARAWTAGYDVFAPNASLLTHSYGRRHLPKFWETVGRTFRNGGAHNALQHYILGRIMHMVGYEDPHMSAVSLTRSDPDFLVGLDGSGSRGGRYGLGSQRTLAAFLKHVGVDMKLKSTRSPEYCTRTWPSTDDGSWASWSVPAEGEEEW